MATRKKKQSWKIGDIFTIPLSDGTFCLAQVVGCEPEVLNSVSVALFDCKDDWQNTKKIISVNAKDIFSILFVTRDALDAGRWAVIANSENKVVQDQLPFEHTRESGFIGARVNGSGNVQEFADAFYGLAAWDDWYKPDYLDAMLVSPDKKPIDRLVFKNKTNL